jgi:hypothetical protein
MKSPLKAKFFDENAKYFFIFFKTNSALEVLARSIHHTEPPPSLPTSLYIVSSSGIS